MPAPNALETRSALISAGVTSPHRSHPRSGSIGTIHSLVSGIHSEPTSVLSGIARYSAGEMLGFMSELTGCPADIADVACEDSIDPDKTVAGLERLADRLREAAGLGATLFAATGHPTGMLEF